MNFKLIVFAFLISFNTLAQIDVFLSVINKKGMDVGLSIVNEFHVIEEYYPGQEKTLAVGTDLTLRLKVGFDKDFTGHGPSELVFFNGEIYNKKGTFKRALFSNQKFIPLNQTKVIRIHLKDQHIEVTLKPVIAR